MCPLWELSLGDFVKGKLPLKVIRAALPEKHFRGRSVPPPQER